jgi:hypothetical protein
MQNKRSHWVTKLGRLSDPDQSREPSAISPEEGLGMMWRLTLDNWIFMKETHAESRLQRHVVRLVRGKS